VLAFAGEFQLPNDLKVTWEYPSDTEVRLNFYVPASIREDDYFGWAGMGIKEIEDGENMSHGDYVTINWKKDNLFDDRWATGNGYPPLDDAYGGTYDLKDIETSEEGDYYVYSWTRALDTDDRKDNAYEIGKDYYIQWAYGKCNLSDEIEHHDYAGTEEFTLTADDEMSFLSFKNGI